jgi:Histidine kinase-, DNA gyrase B-, and HSP90-like ATPase
LGFVPAEKVKLRIGNLAKAVLVSGQAYQDPKDALNEFVSNAADEYAVTDKRGERIRVVVRRKGRAPFLAVEDTGRGMSPDRLRELARNLFESSKAGDARTLGEKAIGLLAFQQLGGRCDVVSRAEDSADTWVLKLFRGSATAELDVEKRRARVLPGTTVYLYDLEPDVVRLMTQRKVVDYLRQRRGVALARGDYVIEVMEGKTVEVVTPDRADGVRLSIPSRQTLWGRIEFALYVTPPDGERRRVAVVGRAGTTIVDDLCELEEFDCEPWNANQVSGQIVFEGLQQSAGRRAILRDREAFPVFVDALRSVEPALIASTVRVAREIDDETNGRITDQLRRVFGRVLKELSDLDNPMRSTVLERGPSGAEPFSFVDSSGNDGNGVGGQPVDGENGTTPPPPPTPPMTDEDLDLPADTNPFEIPRQRASAEREKRESDRDANPDLPPLPNFQPGEPLPPPTQRSARARPSSLPTAEPDPTPGEARSRFDALDGVVLFNERHNDYLQVKDDEAALLDYLATLIAKEYVLYNNPRSSADDLAEELVRVLIRVRRHLPRRITRPKR